MLCRVCGLRVSLTELADCLGYGHESVTEPAEFPGVVVWPYRTRRNSRCGYESFTDPPEFPGTRMKVLHNLQNFHLEWHTVAQNFQTFRAGVKICARTPGICGTGLQRILYPYPRYMWYWVAELTDVPAAGMNVVQDFKTFRVRVRISYRTYRMFGFLTLTLTLR